MSDRREGPPLAPRWLGAEALPDCLRDLSRPPAGLWLLGDAGALEGAPDRHVAIVGTREASPYGIRVAEMLAAACAEAGLVVVSGLARGVDAAAHRAAVMAGGASIGVQGTGVDVPYPASHRTLHAALARSGTVISEMEPGTRATPGCFPRRNRLIAALCRVTVVVEAGYKSGAINTASQALELGRTVAAVPGRIDEERSAGANLLIRDGAQVISGVEELLGLFALSTRRRRDAPFVGSQVVHAGPSDIDGGDGAGGWTGADTGESPEQDGFGLMPLRRIAQDLLTSELDGRIRRTGAVSGGEGEDGPNG